MGSSSACWSRKAHRISKSCKIKRKLADRELTNLIYHSPAEDVKLCTFRRARAACYFVTLVYLLLWIVELFSPYRTYWLDRYRVHVDANR